MYRNQNLVCGAIEDDPGKTNQYVRVVRAFNEPTNGDEQTCEPNQSADWSKLRSGTVTDFIQMFLERHKTYKESHLRLGQLHEVLPKSEFLVAAHVMKKEIRLDQVLAFYWIL